MFIPTPTADVRLKLLNIPDAPRLAEIFTTHAQTLAQWIPWVMAHQSLEGCHAYIVESRRRFAENESVCVGIWTDNQLVGAAELGHLDWLNMSASLGYWLSPAAEGKGLAHAACIGLLGYAVVELGLTRFEIRCAIHNQRAIRLAERLNFQKEGVLRGAYTSDSSRIDAVIYGHVISPQDPTPT